MHSTHISVNMSVVLDTSASLFMFWFPHSFICPHKNSLYRKQGDLLHPPPLQFLQPFFVKSVVGVDVSWVCSHPHQQTQLRLRLLWRGNGPAVQSAVSLAVFLDQLCTEAAHPLTASGSVGFVDCGCWGKKKKSKKKITPNSHCFGCSHVGRSPFIPLLSPSESGNMYCAYTMDVCLLVFIRLNAEYSFVGSVLYWIWMEYCNGIDEVVFAANCFPLPKVRPFTVQISFFSNLSGPGLWRHLCAHLKSYGKFV